MPQNAHTDQLNILISLFSANIAQYKNGQYDEANTRIDFIDKFFALLDWDISNDQGFSESYREVVREDKVKIDGSKKAPDYSFRIGGVRKFFVEAKKPSVNIKDAAEPAYQVRRYAYTAKLPLSILTNFAEFAVYDTRIKPNKNDNAGTARIFYCAFNQYEQHFDFISGVFSKKYDIIYGPVANDTIYRTLIAYENGVLSAEDTIARLKVRQLFDQMTFASEKSLAFLEYSDFMEVPK
jgi:hypothetical protein